MKHCKDPTCMLCFLDKQNTEQKTKCNNIKFEEWLKKIMKDPKYLGKDLAKEAWNYKEEENKQLRSAVKVLYKEFNSKNYYRCGCTWIQDEKLLCPRHEALQNKDVIKAMELINIKN